MQPIQFAYDIVQGRRYGTYSLVLLTSDLARVYSLQGRHRTPGVVEGVL